MKVALFGYGKMGKMIEQVLGEQSGDDDRVILRIDDKNVNEISDEQLAEADVAIEFSVPEAAFSNINKCFRAGVPVVIGTTGWLDRFEEARENCRQHNGAMLYASNFSIGVNIFFEINKRLAELMSRQDQYDVKIEEVHHTQKLDSPSGTAITLAEDILAQREDKKKWVNETSGKKDELSIKSIREAGVPGTHTIEYESETDSIEIKHSAHSRRGFAEGAVAAARWIVGRKGIFSMKDVLSL